MTADEIRQTWDDIHDSLKILRKDLHKYNRAGEYRTAEEKIEFRQIERILDIFADLLWRNWDADILWRKRSPK